MDLHQRKHILQNLDVNNILSDTQHGFREGRSFLTNLLELVENWILPFTGALVNVQEWAKNLELLENLHASVAERIGDLSRNETIGNCLSYAEKFFVESRIEEFRMKR